MSPPEPAQIPAELWDLPTTIPPDGHPDQMVLELVWPDDPDWPEVDP